MLVGYVFHSTLNQIQESQIDDLKATGCDKVIIENLAEGPDHWSQLKVAFNHLKNGDTLVVSTRPRITFKTLKHFIKSIRQIENCKFGIKAIVHRINTNTPEKRSFYHIKKAYIPIPYALVGLDKN